MKSIITSLMLVASLTACCKESKLPSHYTVHLDHSLVAQLQDDSITAASAWTQQIQGTKAPNGNLTLDVSVTDNLPILSDLPSDTIDIIYSDSATVIALYVQDNGELPNAQVAGYTRCGKDNQSVIYLNVELLMKSDDRTIVHVITHEIGHALGLHHTQANTLMYYDVIGASLDLTQADVDQYNSMR